MKSKLILFLAAVVLFQLNINSQTSDRSKPQKKIALIIGNGSYFSSVLANPENDANAMTTVLKKLEFTVLSYTNLAQKEMKKAIDDFSLRLEDSDVALFFYAGHGVQSRGLNYLIPVDASLQTEADVEYDCVPADRVMALMDESGAKIKIMILDACRNNPFEQSWTRAASGKGLALMKASKNAFIAYSTAPGSTAADIGSGHNSLYTSALLESIIIPDLTIDQVFQNVGRIVSQESNNKQIPWKSSSLIMDFYFNREKGTNSETEGVDYFLDPRDNKNYKTLNIGNQLWMQKNLNYISFNNGDTIPEIKDLATWSSAASSALCIYNNIPSNAVKYGRLYNFYTASNVKNICPSGWHVPTNADWDLLVSELGGFAMAGGKMKETGTGNWISPNTSATNTSGFSALPSGLREDRSDYRNLGAYAGFYSADGHVKTLTSESASIGSDSSGSYTTGHSIRCIKGRDPLTETDSATAIYATIATLNGKVNPNLAFTVVSFEYGISKDYGLSVTANQGPAAGSVPVIVSANLISLTPGTTYHFRVKAENIAGLIYGADQTFTTLVPPVASTKAATSNSASSALLNGSVNANNTKTIVMFDYGTTTDYGHTVTAIQSPVSGHETISVSYWLTGLTERTLYHFRVKAGSIDELITGNDQIFSTLQLPIAKTDTATVVASSSAILRGTVNTSNLSTAIIFEYGTTAGYGRSINAAESPVLGISNTPVSVSLIGLTADSTYHFRVKATNIAGTTYGSDLTFNTPDVLKDLVGNAYKTLSVGNQVWMAENLRTTKFNDSTDIPLVTAEKAWSRLKKPAYCWYKNDTSFSFVTGALYNWYTINTRKLCPVGWHAPSEAEWSTLIDYLGDAYLSGGKLKEAGTTHWQKPNYGATNESGFTALPGGSRDFAGSFGYYGFVGHWWSADDSAANSAWFWSMDFSNTNMTRFYLNKKEGFSVRCIKDKTEEIPIKDTTTFNESDFIIDPRDNQRYQTVKYGNQVWMAENLKATKFNDNTEIPLVIDKIAWNRLESPAHCWYENQEVYSTYGALYNWHAINTGKLCPVGWHIPSDEDWTALITLCGGPLNAGGYLKESGTTHWEIPNKGYPTFINSFKALPGGFRNENGEFFEIGKSGYWWSFLKDLKPAGWYRIMNYAGTFVGSRNFKNKSLGLSVRCIKN